jgi:hypothetical protein
MHARIFSIGLADVMLVSQSAPKAWTPPNTLAATSQGGAGLNVTNVILAQGKRTHVPEGSVKIQACVSVESKMPDQC